MTADVLAIGAHPDDVEVGIAGIVKRLVDEGRRVAVLDLTRGEGGSRGTPEERLQEAAEAAHVLGVVQRANAALPDGGLADTPEFQRRLIPFIRQFRPKLILAPMKEDRHPDHEAAHRLVRSANYFAGNHRITSEGAGAPYRAPRILYYAVYREMTMPTFVLDISAQFAAKQEALRAFRSQFFNPDYAGAPQTFVASEAFWESIRTRAAYWGSRIGVAYGECLFADEPVPVAILPGLEAP